MTNRKDKIRLVAEQFGKWKYKSKSEEFEVSFERDGLKIEGEGTDDLDGIVSDKYNVTYKGELEYQDITMNRTTPASIYNPGGEWEQKLDELYELAEKDRAERIEKKLAPFKDMLEKYKKR